jgi:hypothetical protein
MTIRFYAPEKLLGVYHELFESWFFEHRAFLDYFPSVRLDENYSFQDCTSSHLSIVIIRESVSDRETQSQRFHRLVSAVLDNSTFQLLVLVFSTFSREAIEARKVYEKLIPKIKVRYFDIALWPTQTELVDLKTNVFYFLDVESWNWKFFQELDLLFESLDWISKNQNNHPANRMKQLKKDFMEYYRTKCKTRKCVLEILQKINTVLQEKKNFNRPLIKLITAFLLVFIPDLFTVIFPVVKEGKCSICYRPCIVECPDCKKVQYCCQDHLLLDQPRHQLACLVWRVLKLVQDLDGMMKKSVVTTTSFLSQVQYK